MQTTKFAVNVAQTRRDTNHTPGILIGVVDILIGLGQCGTKGDKARFSRPGGGKREQFLFCFFDLVGCVGIKFVLIGVIDHIFAKLDQLAAQIQVIDQLTVVTGVDYRDKIV